MRNTTGSLNNFTIATKKQGVADMPKSLYLKNLEPIRKRGMARAAGNYKLTSEVAKLRIEAIKGAAVMDEAAEAKKHDSKAQRSFANYKTKMTSLRCPNGTLDTS
ncbi:hypothetical protein V3C99_018081 [Haemonchus contortus]|uniref:V-type proton ATPase subunit d n=1 Tax=Haemonchus contortus TaxID=6289 RepID=A0A7I4Z680_HAECO